MVEYPIINRIKIIRIGFVIVLIPPNTPLTIASCRVPEFFRLSMMFPAMEPKSPPSPVIPLVISPWRDTLNL